ncbi:MAG: hypothetical protein HUJ57_06235 [Erysipelotrichaceae bacterium]|nr:hypothetical protein [Erysipelotrichaceae bacterium]
MVETLNDLMGLVAVIMVLLSCLAMSLKLFSRHRAIRIQEEEDEYYNLYSDSPDDEDFE